MLRFATVVPLLLIAAALVVGSGCNRARSPVTFQQVEKLPELGSPMTEDQAEALVRPGALLDGLLVNDQTIKVPGPDGELQDMELFIYRGTNGPDIRIGLEENRVAMIITTLQMPYDIEKYSAKDIFNMGSWDTIIATVGRPNIKTKTRVEQTLVFGILQSGSATMVVLKNDRPIAVFRALSARKTADAVYTQQYMDMCGATPANINDQFRAPNGCVLTTELVTAQ